MKSDMTEDQARATKCPFKFHIFGPQTEHCGRCEASDCMMWRWQMNRRDILNLLREAKERSATREHIDDLVHTEPTGYCGLAGKD